MDGIDFPSKFCQIRLFTNDHHYSRALKLNNEEFWPSDFDKTVTVILAWGLREADLTNCQFSAAGCKVQPRFDPYFDASTHAAQAAFVVSQHFYSFLRLYNCYDGILLCPLCS